MSATGEHRAGDVALGVLTWNVHDHRDDAAAVDRVLRAAAADVVCLQEARRWPGSRRRLERLAGGVGLRHLVGGRASGGTALLAGPRVRVHDARAERLPVRSPWARPRGTASAVLSVAGSAVVGVVSLHLGLDERERGRHVRQVLAQAPAGLPLVVAGDLNEPPGGPSWHHLAARVHDAGGAGSAAATFPAHRPRVRIDTVLVSPELRVVSCGTPPGADEADLAAGSDHRPVLARLLLPRAQDRPGDRPQAERWP